MPPKSFVQRFYSLSEQSKRAFGTSASSKMVSSEFVFPNDQPIVPLEAKTAFQALTKQEQLYAHYLSRASFYGGLIVLIQTSPEAPKIYRLIQRINTAEDMAQLKESAVKAGVSEEDFKAFLVYCSGIFTNMGNYKGFGDSKFLPNTSVETMEKIVRSSAAFKADPSGIETLWASVKEPMYKLNDRLKQLGLGDLGLTTYFSDNCNQEDSEKINKYFKARHLEGYINRAFKTEVNGQTVYEIRNAGVQTKQLSRETFEGSVFEVTTGDYSPLLAKVNENLLKAKEYASNEEEKLMISDYIESFEEGSLEAHKNGSRHWIKDKGPTVESYIGFIETYRDPVGMRGEFEGFVSMVNKDQSAKFQALVDHAESFLERLPWPKEFEKDKFLKPDFTSLDVLTFAGSGIPAGINIPNYDEIRQSEGFKNVNLGNVIAASYKPDKKTTFVSDEDHELLEKWRVSSFEVQVGLHELLGHGSGKLLKKNEDGSLNYNDDLLNPLTGKPVEKCYDAGETYDSKFTNLGSSYEECRAEAVGLYLSCWKDVLKIFNIESDSENVIYVNWLSLCLAALKGVEMWSPASKEWKQAHCQARYVLLKVMLEAGEGFLKIEQTTGSDGKPDLLLSMDRKKIETVGKPAVGEFLKKLQVYKSLGDVEEARKMFNSYSEVNPDGPYPFAKWREIIVARKTPRKMLVQANTLIADEKMNISEYEATHEGMAKSWRDRFTPEEHLEIDSILQALENKETPYFTRK